MQTAITAGAVELTDGSYSRQTLGGRITSLDDANDRSLADCDVIDFGNPTGGETWDACIVYCFVSNDTDSWLMFTYLIDTPRVTAGAMVQFVPNAVGLFVISEEP